MLNRIIYTSRDYTASAPLKTHMSKDCSESYTSHTHTWVKSRESSAQHTKDGEKMVATAVWKPKIS